jgi:fucose 4-O-acetylase-like acetyltransferase
MLETAHSSYKRLIVPFVVFSSFGFVFFFVRKVFISGFDAFTTFKQTIGTFLVNGAFPGNLALWFLLSLFACRLLFNYINIKWPSFALYLCPLICLLLSIIFHCLNISKPWYILNITLGLFFYSVGYLLKDKQYKWSVFIAAMIVLILIAVFKDSSVSFANNSLIYGNFYLWIIYAICAVIFANNFVKKINIRLVPLIKIGQDSMIYYVLHMIVIDIVLCFDDVFKFEKPFLLALLLLSNIVILPIANVALKHSKYKWIVGL